MVERRGRWNPGTQARAGPWFGIVAVTVAGLALRQLVGPVIRWSSPVDDENQMRVAAALLSGNWLGDWGSQPIPHITLSKGPGYPLFVAAIHDTGLSPHLAAYLIYLGGALLLLLALRPVLGWPWASALYIALAFSPHAMSVSFSRPYRDQLVAALALLAFGSAAHLARCLAVPGGWTVAARAKATASAALLAVSLGLLAITRADTIWLSLTCGLVLAVTLWPVAGALGRRGWLRAGCAVLALVLAVLGLPTAIAALNDRSYGVRLTDDYSQGAFADALRAWLSVEPSSAKAFTLVAEPQRLPVYAVSPAAREVRGRLETPSNPWVGFGCPKGTPPTTPPCIEFGAFFGWAVRDPAYQAGYSSAASFQAYFARLAHEIAQGCASGRLTCGSSGISADVPALDRLSWRALFSSCANLVDGALRYEDNLENPQAPVPADHQLLGLWESTIPDVANLAQLLEAGQSPDVIAQQSTVDLLKRVYSTLSVLALVLLLVALLTGVLWREYPGRVALAALVGWAGNTAIVALVLGATNRQLAFVPSYTVPGQAFLITGLVLSTFVCSRLVLGKPAAREATPEGRPLTHWTPSRGHIRSPDRRQPPGTGVIC